MTAPPAPPTGLAGFRPDGSYDELDLSWNPVSGANGYVVLRGTHPAGPYTQAGTTSGTTFSDTGLVPSTTYYYVVEAVNAAGNSVPSNQISGTTGVNSYCRAVAVAHAARAIQAQSPP